MPLLERSAVVRAFGVKIAETISHATSEALGADWQFSISDETVGEHPVSTEDQYYRIKLDGSLTAEAFLGIGVEAFSVLGADRTDGKDAHAGGHREVEMLRLLRAAARKLEALLSESGDIFVSIDSGSAKGLTDSIVFGLEGISEKAASRVSLRLYVTKELETELLSAAAQPLSFPDARATNTSNLDLVLDVTLNVTLRFGQRQLALREVLELGSGSVVELDRQVDEPVDLVLDGRVVARGEAVIIDGNYGIRVTQVVQPVDPQTGKTYRAH